MRSRVWKWLGLTCCTLVLVGQTICEAQSKSSTLLPAPISSLELAKYSNWLNLSAEQRRAFEALHADYKSGFNNLRDGAYATAIKHWGGVSEIPFQKPDLADVIAFISAHESAMSDLANLDEHLFGAASGFMTAEQSAKLPDVMRSRKRDRLLGTSITREWFNEPLMHANLREFVERLDLTGDARTAADTILVEYEIRFIDRLEKLIKGSREVRREWVQAMDHAGITNAMFADSGSNQDVINTIVKAWQRATDSMNSVAQDLSGANRRAFETIAAQLPPAAARQFRREFFKRFYHRNSDDSVERYVQAALRLERLPPGQREVISSHYEAFQAEHDKQLVRLMDLIDQQRACFRPGLGDIEKYNALQQEQGTLMNEQLQRGRELQATIKEMIGAEDAQVVANALRAASESRANDGSQIGAGQEVETFFAPPINTRDLALFGALLGLAPDQHQSMSAAHAAYLDQYEARRERAIHAIKNLRIAFAVRDKESGMSSFAPPSDVEEARRIRSDTIAALAALDSAFFSDLEMSLALTQQHWLGRARFARQCCALCRGERRGLNTLRSYEAYVDLIELAWRQQPAPDELKTAFMVFDGHQSAWLAALQACATSTRDAAELHDLALAHRSRSAESPADEIAHAERKRDEADAHAAKARATMVELNRSILSDLCAALPQHATDLQAEYERQAFPRAFSDSASVDALLNAALKLTDLTDSQRSALENLAASYRPAYRELCVKLIEACKQWDAILWRQPDGSQKRDAIKLAWDQLLFERNELHASARNALERTLSAAQLQKIGLTPE